MTVHHPLSTATSPHARYDSVDALRGFAMLWMTVFHFCFDLSHFGYWPQSFRADPFWTLQRTAIVSLFLFCAGLGQAIALQQGQGWVRFGRRWLQIAGCAVLVTVSSWVMFPQSFIYFGVLHGMAVMLVVARCTAGWGHWLWLAGAIALALPWCAKLLLSGVDAEYHLVGSGCGAVVAVPIGIVGAAGCAVFLAATGISRAVESELLHGASASHDRWPDGAGLGAQEIRPC